MYFEGLSPSLPHHTCKKEQKVNCSCNAKLPKYRSFLKLLPQAELKPGNLRTREGSKSQNETKQHFKKREGIAIYSRISCERNIFQTKQEG
jgi:hypothetical protein